MSVASYPIEILQTPGQVTIITEAFSEVRRVYLDQPQLPIDEVPPGYYGHSVGKLGRRHAGRRHGRHQGVGAGYQNMPHSDRMRITERIRLVTPDVLHDQITIDDPVVAREAGDLHAGLSAAAGLRDGGVRVREQPRVHRRTRARVRMRAAAVSERRNDDDRDCRLPRSVAGCWFHVARAGPGAARAGTARRAGAGELAKPRPDAAVRPHRHVASSTCGCHELVAVPAAGRLQANAEAQVHYDAAQQGAGRRQGLPRRHRPVLAGGPAADHDARVADRDDAAADRRSTWSASFMNSLRIIYIDGRPHSDPDVVVPQLQRRVDRPLGRRHAGGRHEVLRRPPSLDRLRASRPATRLHIVERIKLMNNGQTLEIEYTDDRSRRAGKASGSAPSAGTGWTTATSPRWRACPISNEHMPSTQSKDNVR